MTHGEPDTFPRTGDVIGFCTPEQVLDVAEKVVTVQRDLGDRSNRKQARLKYTIERIGLARFGRSWNGVWAIALSPARAFAFTDNGDRLGWAEGENGAWHYHAVRRERPRRDLAEPRLLSGLHAIAELDVGRFIITPNQNLVLADIPAERRGCSRGAARRRTGWTRRSADLRRNAVACVALPTCGLALAESERYLPSLVTRLEDELERARTGGGRHHHPHDRLPERLRASLHVGNRSRRPLTRSLQSLSRRRLRRLAAVQAVSHGRRRRRDRRGAGTAAARLRANGAPTASGSATT